MIWLILLGALVGFSVAFTLLRLLVLWFVYKDGLEKSIRRSFVLTIYDVLANVLPGLGSLYIVISNWLAEKLAIIDAEVRKTMETEQKLQSKVGEMLDKTNEEAAKEKREARGKKGQL